MHKIVLTTLLVCLALTCSAQNLELDVKRVVSQYSTLTEPPYRAKEETLRIMSAYSYLGESGLDSYLNTMDASWYSGIDVYLGENKKTLVETIETDAEAQFRLNKTVTVTVADDGVNYLIVVYSFP